MPTAWSHATTETAPSLADERWWDRFQDHTLDALVTGALQRNNDLAAAAVRVRRAQFQAGLAANARAPQMQSVGVSADARQPLTGGRASTTYGANISVAYEVDLWHRLGDLRNAAAWEAQATAEDRDAIALALTGTATTLYFRTGYLRDRRSLDVASLAYARRILALVETQYAAGGASGLEVAEAQRTVESQEAALTQLTQQQVETQSALAVLLDGEMAVVPVASLDSTLDPPVEAGVPVDVLASRPDLRAAELRLRAHLATGDATRASFYPSLSLTGTAGSSSNALRDLLANPVGTLAASLATPFLNFERARLTKAVAGTAFDEAVEAFQQVLQQALADVDNALSARTQFRLQGEHLEQVLINARTAERLYEIRYRAGAVALRDWLAAQDARRAAEAAMLENRLARLTNYVTLALALGGR